MELNRHHFSAPILEIYCNEAKIVAENWPFLSSCQQGPNDWLALTFYSVDMYKVGRCLLFFQNQSKVKRVLPWIDARKTHWPDRLILYWERLKALCIKAWRFCYNELISLWLLYILYDSIETCSLLPPCTKAVELSLPTESFDEGHHSCQLWNLNSLSQCNSSGRSSMGHNFSYKRIRSHAAKSASPKMLFSLFGRLNFFIFLAIRFSLSLSFFVTRLWFSNYLSRRED